MVQMRDDIVGLDSAILMAPKVWETSGHVATFTDPLVDCRNCKERFRADHLPESGACPNCGAKDSFTEARNFNLMFQTHVGPVEDVASVAYLRPETAQGIFVNFKNVQTVSRKKPPFGIAQIGKAFRNEITPGNFTYRTREFEQMEMEFFVPPPESPQWFEYWVTERFNWYVEHGIPESKLRIRPHDPDELSHYSIGTSDIEFAFPWGWGELEGIAQRTDFDLRRHQEESGEDLTYFDQTTDTHYLPFVVEPAAGADRATLAFMLSAYDEEEVNGEKRTVMRLHPRLAPVKVAVLPLSKKDELAPLAAEIAGTLRPHFQIDTDTAGAIGRRYRRQDEVGTPFCVTIDFDSLEDHAVTVRERDSMNQERIPVKGLLDYLRPRFD
jgi:glycyl-tRNA synthetase